MSDIVNIILQPSDIVNITIIDTLIVGNQDNAFPYILPFNLE